MDVVIKELLGVTQTVLRNKHAELHEFEVLYEKLLEVNEIEIKGRNRINGTIYPTKLPNEYKSLARLRYIIKKWFFERMSGEEEKTVYVFGEENDKNHSLDDKITSAPSRP
jgi:hypothetical protein